MALRRAERRDRRVVVAAKRVVVGARRARNSRRWLVGKFGCAQMGCDCRVELVRDALRRRVGGLDVGLDSFSLRQRHETNRRRRARWLQRGRASEL